MVQWGVCAAEFSSLLRQEYAGRASHQTLGAVDALFFGPTRRAAIPFTRVTTAAVPPTPTLSQKGTLSMSAGPAAPRNVQMIRSIRSTAYVLAVFTTVSAAGGSISDVIRIPSR
ncbi:hypothetical protein GCM10022384_18680 [Streptomyces marokkonensis]|uniref:Uncharacterized protein n=1 Tax=Streptomyces marokkonensis TaxID=324855 RepID=A0ABP7PL25_9ACTN